ncbi:hypothetical protein GOV13_00830 [Candidatus Pacearchaeota archaeon]|nr:hypothetical protein [Candidatus Pacearchaeota archaeon]
MNVLDYLDIKTREGFSIWDPINFKKDGKDYLAYMARLPILDLDLAIMHGIESDSVHYRWFKEASLKAYKNDLTEDILDELKSIVCEERLVDNPERFLLRRLKDTIESSFV